MIHIAFVPARKGSTRLKSKALCEIDGKSLLEIALEKCKVANVFNEIVCLGDDTKFKQISDKLQVEYINRNTINASNDAKSDEVVNEVINCKSSHTITWVNLTHPFTSLESIKSVIDAYKRETNFDTIYTAHEWKGHAFMNKEKEIIPLNFELKNKFAQTQDLNTLQLLTYGLMSWKCSEFQERYAENQSGMMNGKIKLLQVNRLESFWIKYQQDLEEARRIHYGAPIY